MIGCPSDIEAEVEIAKDIILKWSCMNAEARGIVVLPLHWKDNAYPGYGMHPQKMLDKQLVDKSDMLVCIFGSKIGTATDTSDSGSIEEIEEHIKGGKPVMIFLKQNVNISTISLEQLQKLQEFKARIQNQAMWCEYIDIESFEKVFSEKLTLFLNDHWYRQEPTPNESNISPTFSEEEIMIFSRWANDKYDTPYTYTNFIGGRTEIHLAYRFGIALTNNKERAWWEDFIDRLLSLGYVKLNKLDSKNHRLYKITAKGFKFAETLPQYDENGVII